MEEKAHKEARKYETEFRQLKEESLQTQDEVNKLRTQVKTLGEENDKLIQHSNSKQKIQYHVKIKQENNALQEDIKILKQASCFHFLFQSELLLTFSLLFRQTLTKHSIAIPDKLLKSHEKENLAHNAGTASTPERELRSSKTQ